MSVREQLQHARRRIALLAAVGVLLILIAGTAAEAESALMLAIAGSIVGFVAVYQLCAVLRCPQCGGSLAATLLSWRESPRRCPACGLDFTREPRDAR